MEDDVMTTSRSSLSSSSSRVWRRGATRRVGVGAAISAAGGAALATIRHMPAVHVARTSASCAIIACPFLALREVVAGGLCVDGPVASAIAGGVAGYVGALAFSSTAASWKAVSHGAMVVGVGAGLVDVVASTVDFRWKSYLLAKRDAQEHEQRRALHQRGNETEGNRSTTMDIKVEVKDLVSDDITSAVSDVVASINDVNGDEGNGTAAMSMSSSQSAQRVEQQTGSTDKGKLTGGAIIKGAKKSGILGEGRMDRNMESNLPVWLPSGGTGAGGAVAKGSVNAGVTISSTDGMVDKKEYENLLQSQKATAAALQHEQDRIARLLATIEQLKADAPIGTKPTNAPRPSEV